MGLSVCYEIHVIILNGVLSIYNNIECMKSHANTLGCQNAGVCQENLHRQERLSGHRIHRRRRRRPTLSTDSDSLQKVAQLLLNPSEQDH